MSVHDYLIDHAGFNWPNLLKDWTWLLPNEFTVWIMNRFGDVFIVLDDGTVHILDVEGGTLKRVADSRDDFCVKVDTDDNANDWLMIPLIDRLVAAGMTLEPGECYHHKMPPIVGGEYTIENTTTIDIAEHLGFYGSIHQQLKDVPDGTPVELKVEKAHSPEGAT
jgi:hypothetical protein